MTDPFERLAMPIEPQQPRPSFARALRARLVEELGLDPLTAVPTIELPRRKPMTTTAPATRTAAATPYLTVHDGAAAIEWYVQAFGGEEQLRVVADDGTLGHAEITVGAARFMLSDEHPALGVVGPRTVGGTTVAIHLEVDDVDATYARAVAAGATALQEPADQPHGARHGTLLDPFGHRWMLSQQVEDVPMDEYAARSAGSGYTVVAPPRQRATGPGGVWASVYYRDAMAGIRFLVDVLGFEEQLVVENPPGSGNVVHSQLHWPEGGIVSPGTYDPDNVYSIPPGQQALYVVTADPQPVWERCQAAGVAVVQEPYTPEYDPDGWGFGVRDPEGNIWSFGTYAGEGA